MSEVEPQRWLHNLKGRFLVFEGPDGSGKSTQYARIVEDCRAAGLTVCEVREPGGTAISEKIRDLLLDTKSPDMSIRCEMMLYMASRAQLVDERIRPALERGEVVIADRFVTSTIAYQGHAGGVPVQDILAVARAACRDVWPDLIVVFDVDEATAQSRMDRERDRIEQRGAAYREKVREGYRAQVREEPARHVLLDARGSVDEVNQAMRDAIQARFA
jgi:dTMP kinase